MDNSAAKVPVIQGTTRDEHRTFVAAIETFTGHAATGVDHRGDIEGFFGKGKGEAAKVLAEYPRGACGSVSTALSVVWTDSAWACMALDTDQMLSRQLPTYAYEFADEKAPWAGDRSKPNSRQVRSTPPSRSTCSATRSAR